MDEVVTNAGAYLIGLGLPGIVIIALAVATVKLFQLYHATQEKRVEEGKAQFEAACKLGDKFESLKASLDIMARTQSLR